MTYFAIFPPLYFKGIKESAERREETKVIPIKVFFLIFLYEFVCCRWLYSKNEKLFMFYRISL